MFTPLTRIAILVLLLVSCAITLHAQEGSDPLFKNAQAIERLLSETGEQTLLPFAKQHFTDDYFNSMSEQEVIGLLKKIREAAHDFGGVGLEALGAGKAGMNLELPDTRVRIEFDVDPASGKISRLELVGIDKAERLTPITWENFRTRLNEESAAGFSGTVLITRHDSIVFEQGYGYADREEKIPNTAQTIFAIGSTPIDFTNAALLKLVEQDRLRLNEPITKYIDNVPEDKQAITIQLLRTGGSGLPDFHETPEDEDPDLSWIDRRTAIDRIMGQELLFAPGESNRHSHSAWVLLTAIVEIASGEQYENFLNEQFFKKAGMTRTGSYTFSQQFDPSEVAIGYGSSQPTDPNSPQHWGKTSWLVKGSGGMVSTVGDLWRWHMAMKNGMLLGADAMEEYPLYSAGVGGNMRGFINCFDYEPDAGYILCSNSHVEMDDQAFQVSMALERMVVGE